MESSRAAGSFRDPTGFVFVADGVVYRQVNAGSEQPYRRLIESGLYEDLVHNGLLVDHEEVALRLGDAPPAFAVLRPRRIPFISYPYEWCFGQLRAAALLTLELQKRALAKGLVLRDASAYNVQFEGARAVFIDTLSFGEYSEGAPWVAYRQFCQHFLAPLALTRYVDPSLGTLSRLHLDGVPVALAARLLPWSSRMRPGLFTHLHMHAKSGVQGREQHTGSAAIRPSRGMSHTAMLGLIDSLTRTVEGLTWSPPETLWSTYTEHSNYSAQAQAHKQRLVQEALDVVCRDVTRPSVWDLGANTGVYSRIAAAAGGQVVSFDLDPAAVERHYRICQQEPGRAILPLVQDLTNPSPATGWRHAERLSLVDRGPTDVALGLALVHHLALGGNIPLDDLASFFKDICRYLIVEFVPKDDSQVQRMLALRDDVFGGYSEAGFEAAFAAAFRIVHSTPIEDSLRRLYLMERR